MMSFDSPHSCDRMRGLQDMSSEEKSSFNACGVGSKRMATESPNKSAAWARRWIGAGEKSPPLLPPTVLSLIGSKYQRSFHDGQQSLESCHRSLRAVPRRRFALQVLYLR